MNYILIFRLLEHTVKGRSKNFMYSVSLFVYLHVSTTRRSRNAAKKITDFLNSCPIYISHTFQLDCTYFFSLFVASDVYIKYPTIRAQSISSLIFISRGPTQNNNQTESDISSIRCNYIPRLQK